MPTAPPRVRPSLAILLVLALLPLATLAAPALAAPARAGASASTPHEVWVLDQGTDLIHVHDSRGYDEVARIDVSPAALREEGYAGDLGAATVPHMIDFDSQHRYAFIASTAGRVTIVIDAAAREVVAVLPTGPGSHMAAVTPDDAAVWVAVLGAPGDVASQRLVEIPLDLDAAEPTFAIGRSVVVKDALEPYAAERGWEFPGYRPVCHQYTPDSSEAWVTLGPEWNKGGLFVLDLETAEVTAAFDPDVVKANCGVAVNRQGTRVVANWSGRVDADNGDTDGEFYVFNAKNHTLQRTESARGYDAHGVRFTPDGKHLWAVNRISDNALIIDGNSFKVRREIPAIADTPDILDFSPDGTVSYITQRGPTPQSGGVHAAAGSDPGLALVDTRTFETIQVLRPERVTNTAGAVVNDVHGVGVRPLAQDAPRGKAKGLDIARGVVAERAAGSPFTCHVEAR